MWSQDQSNYDAVKDIYLKYDGTLSLADAVTLDFNIFKLDKIVSFDSDFDKVKNIEGCTNQVKDLH